MTLPWRPGSSSRTEVYERAVERTSSLLSSQDRFVATRAKAKEHVRKEPRYQDSVFGTAAVEIRATGSFVAFSQRPSQM